MKYIVTGGAGFIGSNLVDCLVDVSKAKKLLDWEPLTQLEDWIINYKSKIGLN